MRVLLVEDDVVIARELQLRWQRSDWSTVACATLADAERVLREGAVDLIVLDVNLPDGDGLAWLGRLRQRDRATPVLVLTARDRISDRVHGLRTGADDYLVKPFAADELDARIEVLTRRSRQQRGETASFGTLTWLRHEGAAYAAGQRLQLSPREFEVLGMLMRRAPRLLPKRVLIDNLAEKNLDVGDSAAEVYVSRLRRKLVGSGAAIRTLRGFGYLLELEADAGSPAADPAR